MKINNGRNHNLTIILNLDSAGKPVNSDHFPLQMEVKLESNELRKKIGKLGQIAFKELTTNTTVFTDCVKTCIYGAHQWISTVKSHCNRKFKKIRI